MIKKMKFNERDDDVVPLGDLIKYILIYFPVFVMEKDIIKKRGP